MLIIDEARITNLKVNYGVAFNSCELQRIIHESWETRKSIRETGCIVHLINFMSVKLR